MKSVRGVIGILFLPLTASALTDRQNSGQIRDQFRDLVRRETRDRHVDQAALQAQDLAAQKLKLLLKKYKGTAQEAVLMMRLATVLQESAAIEFRIAYGKAHQSRTTPQLSRYKGIQSSLVGILNQLIQTYPRFSAIDHCLFMRGKANEELSKKNEAKSDYLTVVHKYPDSDRVIQAYMALAEMAIEKSQHLEAISYLTQVEKAPKSPQYPYSLYKLAWSYYNLKDFPKGLSYLEKNIRFYDGISKTTRVLSPADSSMRENSLLDAVTFYSDASEASPSSYGISDAKEYFRKIEKGLSLGKMQLRFAKILRSHRRDGELVQWKNILMKEESHRPETVETVVTVLDHFWNQRKLLQMIECAKDLVALYLANGSDLREGESFLLARNKLGDIADFIQKTLVEHKGSENETLLKALSEIYTVYLQIVPETDPRVAQIHYNRAETLFEIGQFEQATSNYRWILEHWNPKTKLVRNEVELKAVIARYNQLKKEGAIPKDLAAMTLESESSDKSSEELISKLTQTAREWVRWVDALPELKAKESVLFEANRLIYRDASRRLASERLLDFALQRPESSFAVPSATLVLDTYIKSSNWLGCRELARKFAGNFKKGSTVFSDKLKTAVEDCTFKIAENYFNSKDVSKTLSWVEKLQDEFPRSPRVADGLMLVSKIHLQNNQERDARKALSLLIHDFPGSANSRVALLNRAGLQEKEYEFNQAIQDYQQYLQQSTAQTGQSQNGSQISDIQKRLSFLKWLVGDSSFSVAGTSTGKTAGRCVHDTDELVAKVETLDSEGQRMAALDLLKHSCEANLGGGSISLEPKVKRIIRLASHGISENRVIWALYGLKQIQTVDLRNRLSMIKSVAKSWDDLDPLVKIVLLPEINTAVPQHLISIRNEIKRLVPVNRASPQAITRRVEWIKEVDGAGSAALNLPWSRIRAEVLLQLALVYSDFASTLKAIPIPKELLAENSKGQLKEYQKQLEDITHPFESRSREFGQKSMEVATRLGVEKELLERISSAFPEYSEKSTLEFNKQVPQVDRWKTQAVVGTSIGLHLLPLNRLSVADSTTQSESSLNERIRLIRIWTSSYEAKNWAKSGFILQQMIRKKCLPEYASKMMQGLTLVAAGAQAEGLSELREAASLMDRNSNHLADSPHDQRLEEKFRSELKLAVLKEYIQSRSGEQVAKLIQEVESESQIASSVEKKGRRL